MFGPREMNGRISGLGSNSLAYSMFDSYGSGSATVRVSFLFTNDFGLRLSIQLRLSQLIGRLR